MAPTLEEIGTSAFYYPILAIKCRKDGCISVPDPTGPLAITQRAYDILIMMKSVRVSLPFHRMSHVEPVQEDRGGSESDLGKL